MNLPLASLKGPLLVSPHLSGLSLKEELVTLVERDHPALPYQRDNFAMCN